MGLFSTQQKIKSYKGHSGDMKDPVTQMEHVISYTGPAYFPLELRQETFQAEKTRPRLRSVKKKAQEGDRSDEDSAGSGNEGEEDVDFGGEDYAHNYYQDEERDDDFDEGGDDDVF